MDACMPAVNFCMSSKNVVAVVFVVVASVAREKGHVAREVHF